jgi:hypothetical protein
MRAMELEELTAALAAPKPDREAVLASFRRKHHWKRVKRRLWCFGGLAACVVVALTFVTFGQTRPRTSVTVSPAGCAPAPLAQSLAQARQAGASILIAYGSPTGTTAASGYQGVVLHSVQMLSGPAIASGTTAWADGTGLRGGTGAMPAKVTSGQMLAIAWPAAVVGSEIGPLLRTAPVRGGNVLLTRSGCQDVASLTAPPGLAGAVVPGSQSAPDGLYAIPLRIVEQAAASPLARSRGVGRQPAPTPASNPSTASSSTANGNRNANGKASAKASKASAKASKASAKASKAAAKASAKASKASAKASKAAAKGKAKGNGNGHG